MADDGKVVIELVGKDSATQTFVKSIQDMQSSIQRLESSGKNLGSSTQNRGWDFSSAFSRMGSSISLFASAHISAIAEVAASYAGMKGFKEFWVPSKMFPPPRRPCKSGLQTQHHGHGFEFVGSGAA